MSEPHDDAALPLRGGQKLDAALSAFKLANVVEGTSALDIGASHGGFTEVLLNAGATHVTAIDVGHDQLRSHLRTDPRVTLHERCNFRTLPLRIAAGPFDFFSMDVSFASARSMLRALAHRLRNGAQGIVLVKPQFELPKVLVPPGGVVQSHRLRKFAFNRFRKRAQERGFQVLARIESPVLGAAGNCEWLVHLMYAGEAVPTDVPC